MPYVTEEVKQEFEEYLDPLLLYVRMRGVTGGDLTYVITAMMIAALEAHGWIDYDKARTVIDSATEAAAEFRRRVLQPYEDRKAEENGDVFAELTRRLRMESER